MRDILYDYNMNATTWVYVSSMLMIGIYFKFNRLWSVRNLDLIGLIAFSPGLLLLTVKGAEQLGYVWLFTVSALFLVRLLLDPLLVRRPLLEPNLSAGGLTFTSIALLVFLMSNVVTARPKSDAEGARAPQWVGAQWAAPAGESAAAQYGPGYRMFYLLASFTNEAFVPADDDGAGHSRRALVRRATARTAAILGHLAIVIGVVLIGYRHFDNIHTGVAAATLYLLLPYTAQLTARVDHVIPGAILVWAVAAYRRPLVAGILLGLAAGVVYYPLFLVPLWCGFYWRRGLVRFGVGVLAALLLLVASLALSAGSLDSFLSQLQQMFGWTSLLPGKSTGFWALHDEAYRIPLMAAFVALCGSLALWPVQKNLGVLLSCSAAVMLATQFWHAYEGGIYMAWYLPLLLLTIFRPNLEDRLALTAVV